MRLASQIDDFILYLKKRRSFTTVKNYRHCLEKFLDWAGDIEIAKINADLVSKYKLFLSEWTHPQSKTSLKVVTQNYFLIALRAFLKYLSEKQLQVFPPDQIKLNKHPTRQLNYLDQTSLQSLLNGPNLTELSGIRDRAILETLATTGLLVSELVKLNRGNLSENKDLKIITGSQKHRVIPISDSAFIWLEKYLSLRHDQFKPLFIRFQGKVEVANEGEKMRLTARSVERIVAKYAKAAGLGIKATPQSIRHTFAKSLLAEGTNLETIQGILGHSHISTTQIYTKI